MYRRCLPRGDRRWWEHPRLDLVLYVFALLCNRIDDGLFIEARASHSGRQRQDAISSDDPLKPETAVFPVHPHPGNFPISDHPRYSKNGNLVPSAASTEAAYPKEMKLPHVAVTF